MPLVEVCFGIESSEILHNSLFQRYDSSTLLFGVQNDNRILKRDCFQEFKVKENKAESQK